MYRNEVHINGKAASTHCSSDFKMNLDFSDVKNMGEIREIHFLQLMVWVYEFHSCLKGFCCHCLRQDLIS